MVKVFILYYKVKHWTKSPYYLIVINYLFLIYFNTKGFTNIIQVCVLNWYVKNLMITIYLRCMFVLTVNKADLIYFFSNISYLIYTIRCRITGQFTCIFTVKLFYIITYYPLRSTCSFCIVRTFDSRTYRTYNVKNGTLWSYY